jgi:hypothetical protein
MKDGSPYEVVDRDVQEIRDDAGEVAQPKR